METEPYKIMVDKVVLASRLKPILKAIFANTHRLTQQQNHHQIYPFICKVKRALKTRMAQNQRSCYMALILMQDYSKIDNYGYPLSRVKCRVVDQKTMPLQVECMIVLSNGDIAITGGTMRFEVHIYRHDLSNVAPGTTGRQRE